MFLKIFLGKYYRAQKFLSRKNGQVLVSYKLVSYKKVYWVIKKLRENFKDRVS